MFSKENFKQTISYRTIGAYTLLFLVACLFIYTYYFLIGGSFIWESDGYTQHFQLFDDYVKVLQGLFRGQGFSQWNWSIGPGADTVTAYGYYVIGDPFAYLGIFFPESLREFSFHLLIFVRMWCIGLAYLIYAKKFKISHGAGLLGSLMYTFSFYVVMNVSRHPFFIMPMIWLPLLCLGAEKVLRKESGVLFSVMVAVSAIANFYFFYKLTVLVFIYGVVRYGMMHSFKDFKKLSAAFGRCLLYYLIGVLISAVVFLPMVGGFLTGARSADRPTINLLFYQPSYYLLLVHNLFVPDAYLWTVGGFSIFTLFTFIYLWKVKQSISGFMVAILTVMLLFPFFGSFMNGMSGPYNRFSFAVPFFFALASGQLLDYRNCLEDRDIQVAKYLLVGTTIFYTIAAVIRSQVLYYLIPLVIGWAIWFLLKRERSSRPVNRHHISLAMIGLVLVNMAANALAYYHSYGRNAIAGAVELGTSISEYQDTLGGAEEVLPDDDLYRVGVSSQDGHIRNQFIYHDLMGLSTYLSITNGYIAEFAQEMDLASYQIIQPLRNGMDDRRILNHLMGIEYIITQSDNEAYLPQGYEVVYETDEKPSFIVAETKAQFPLARVEDTVISREDFEELNPVEREQFLTQGVVLETEDFKLLNGQFDNQIPPAAYETIDYTVEFNNPMAQPMGDNHVNIDQADATVTLNLEDIDQVGGYDLFVDMRGVSYKSDFESFWLQDKTGYDIRFYYGEQRKSYRQSDEYTFSTYFHRDQYFVNLGEVSEEEDQLTLQFADTGEFTFDELEVIAVPVNENADQQLAEEKNQDALMIQVFEDERVAGTLDTDRSGILITSIPYERGWQVTVDGREVDTVRTNIGFVGIPVEPGDHQITFTYQNPDIKYGKVITLIGLALLAVSQLIYKKNSNKSN